MDKPILEMTPEELNAYIDKKNMERQNQQSDELPPPLFYRVMQDDFFSIRAQKAEKTIVLHGQVVGSQLQLYVPAVEAREDVTVNDNEIVLDNLNLRLVIDLFDDELDDPDALF